MCRNSRSCRVTKDGATKNPRKPIDTLLPREKRSPFCFPNPRYLRKERNGARFARRKWRTWKRTAENERKNHSPARLPGYPWGLVWRRCSTFAGHVWAMTTATGEGESAWAYGEKPTPDSHFVFSPDATRQIGLYATSSSVPLCSLRIARAYSRIRVFAYSHASLSRARARARE